MDHDRQPYLGEIGPQGEWNGVYWDSYSTVPPNTKASHWGIALSLFFIPPVLVTLWILALLVMAAIFEDKTEEIEVKEDSQRVVTQCGGLQYSVLEASFGEQYDAPRVMITKSSAPRTPDLAEQEEYIFVSVYTDQESQTIFVGSGLIISTLTQQQLFDAANKAFESYGGCTTS